MGIDYNAYLGPYLRVKVEVKKVKVDCCEKHDVPPDAAFCPKCGTSKKDRITTQEQEVPEHWAWEYKKKGKSVELNDYLSSTSHMTNPPIQKDGDKRYRVYLYIPNRYWDELNVPRLGSRSGDYEDEIELENLDMGKAKKDFAKLFKEEIDYIKQWHEVEVKFGYISYCS